MTKFRLIGAAAVLSTVLVGPALAQRTVSHPGHYSQSSYCATREAGNPHSEQNDYQAWSAGKSAGWDSRGDDACSRNPMSNGNF
jgi:hypothetical protein